METNLTASSVLQNKSRATLLLSVTAMQVSAKLTLHSAAAEKKQSSSSNPILSSVSAV